MSTNTTISTANPLLRSMGSGAPRNLCKTAEGFWNWWRANSRDNPLDCTPEQACHYRDYLHELLPVVRDVRVELANLRKIWQDYLKHTSTTNPFMPKHCPRPLTAEGASVRKPGYQLKFEELRLAFVRALKPEGVSDDYRDAWLLVLNYLYAMSGGLKAVIGLSRREVLEMMERNDDNIWVVRKDPLEWPLTPELLVLPTLQSPGMKMFPAPLRSVRRYQAGAIITEAAARMRLSRLSERAGLSAQLSHSQIKRIAKAHARFGLMLERPVFARMVPPDQDAQLARWLKEETMSQSALELVQRLPLHQLYAAGDPQPLPTPVADAPGNDRFASPTITEPITEPIIEPVVAVPAAREAAPPAPPARPVDSEALNQLTADIIELWRGALYGTLADAARITGEAELAWAARVANGTLPGYRPSETAEPRISARDVARFILSHSTGR